jgi:ABC-type dipeptide/oligopeptide/nickel transport system permease subunit
MSSVAIATSSRPRLNVRTFGWVLLGVLFFGSLLISTVFVDAARTSCPLGMDAARPDRSVCELSLGGLWVSMALGLLAGALATLVGWAGPARMFRNRLVSLSQQEFVGASVALGAGRWHLLRLHLWPGLRAFALTVFLTRLPSAILAESTVSFFGIARVEPMSLGRYLGTSVTTVLYEGGARIVLPAWALLVLVVLGATLARAEDRK